MSGLFLSHSSEDKPFVTKLAIDLVNRGMPVWFDMWQMDTGDSLTTRLYSGIEDSEYLIIVLSPASVASRWVQKELTAALALEERRGSQLIVPIRVGDCDVPLSIADRLYADFTSAYLEPLNNLVDRLKQLGVDEMDEPPEHALIPLVFERGIYLDGAQLDHRLASLRPRLADGFRFEAAQFVAAPNSSYQLLRHRLLRRVESIEDDPYFTPKFSADLKSRYNRFIALGVLPTLLVNTADGRSTTSGRVRSPAVVEADEG